MNLPAGFPKLDSVTYTQKSMQGPTQVVEGYYRGGVKSEHDDFKAGFQSAGFTVLVDEIEAHDSEVSWKGKGRTGQVALRDECGQTDRTYVHITNRPA